MNIAIGDKEVDFVFQGDRLIYPSYAGKESMVLHYDFSGMKNSDVTKGIARDLSGNGNNGVLNGFGYVEGSGYQDDGLVFDGVDDYVNAPLSLVTSHLSIEKNWTIEISLRNVTIEAGVVTFTDDSLNRNTIRITNGGYLEIVNYNGEYTSTSYYLGSPFTGAITIRNAEDEKLEAYINGQKEILIGSSTGGVPSNAGLIIGRGYMGGNISTMVYLDALIASTRITSRALTPAEIQTNYLIDKQRFNLP